MLNGVIFIVILLESIVERLEQRIMPKKQEKNEKTAKTKNYSTLNQSYSNISTQTVLKQQNTKCCSSDNIYFKVFIFGIVWLIFVYLIPSLIFANLTELNWTLIDAFYYCFISISTIGFGDFVPGQNEVGWSRNVYRLLMTSKILILFSLIFKQELKRF